MREVLEEMFTVCCEKLPLGKTIFREDGKCKNPYYCRRDCEYFVKTGDICEKESHVLTPLYLPV